MVKRDAIIAVLVAGIIATPLVTSHAQDSTTLPVEANGAATPGYPALVLNGWDIRGVRNVQGGYLSNDVQSLNLDIGAGSTANPGDLVLNYDVGRDTLIFDGHHHLVARFGPKGIVFYQRPRVVPFRWRRAR